MQLAWLRDSWRESYCLSLIWGYLYSALQLNTPPFIGVALLTKKKKKPFPLDGGIGCCFSDTRRQHQWLSEKPCSVAVCVLLGNKVSEFLRCP